MTAKRFSLTPGESRLLAGLMLTVVGIVLICVTGEVSYRPQNPFIAAGLSLVVTGFFLWIYGAITRQSELLENHE